MKRPTLATSTALLLLLATAAPLPAVAETLPEAVLRALTAHPELRGERARAAAAEQTVRQAGASRYPSLDARYAYGYQRNENVNSQDGRDSDRREWSVALRQGLYDGGQGKHTRLQRRAETRSALAAVAEAEDVLSFNVARAYLDLLRADQLLAISRDNVAVHDETLGKALKRVNSGAGRRPDEELVTARLALARSTLTARNGDRRDAEIRYLGAVGKFPGELTPPQQPSQVPATREAAIELALANNSSLVSAKADAEAAAEAAEAARGPLLPQVDFELSLSDTTDLDGEFGFRDSEEFRALLVARYNWQKDRDSGRVAELELRAVAANERINQLQRTIVQEVSTAWNTLQTARERLSDLQRYASASDEVRSVYQQQFELGFRGMLAVLDSENELANVRASHVNAHFDSLNAEYRLLASIGLLAETFQ